MSSAEPDLRFGRNGGDRLPAEGFDLTLFAGNPYALEFLIVRCSLSP